MLLVLCRKTLKADDIDRPRLGGTRPDGGCAKGANNIDRKLIVKQVPFQSQFCCTHLQHPPRWSLD